MVEVSDIILRDISRNKDSDWQISNSGDVDYFEIYLPDVVCDITNIRAEKITWDQGSTFIVTHPNMGLLGQSRLGSIGTVERVAESRMLQELEEDYTSSTYIDTNRTNAEFTGAGSVTFGGGSYPIYSTSDFSLGSGTSNVGSSGDKLYLV